MKIDDYLTSQNAWRSLRVRGRSRILQVFADYSPEAWWWTRYKPSVEEARKYPISTSFISRSGFSSQISIALMESGASHVVFHRRTITSKVYREVVTNFPSVKPVFVVGNPDDMLRSPTMPVTDWLSFVDDARDGYCTLAIEETQHCQLYYDLGVQSVKCLPPLYGPPLGFKHSAKIESDYFRLLLCEDAVPHLDIVQQISSLRCMQVDGKPVQLYLCLGEGPESIFAEYRAGVIQAARSVLKPNHLVVWDSVLRTDHLKRSASEVDGLLVLRGSTVSGHEYSYIDVPLYQCCGGRLSKVELRDDRDFRLSTRHGFWGGLLQEPSL